MNLDQVIRLAQKYIVDYIRVFYETLTQPSQRFRSIPLSKAPDRYELQSKHVSFGDIWLDSELISFVIISIVLGTILNTFVPSRKYSVDIINSGVVTFACWLFFSFFTHALCHLFRGKASFEKTLWTSLHVFSALFVVSSFVNLAGGMIVKLPTIYNYLVPLGKLGDSVANNPFYIYFLVQFTLMIVYLPIAIKNIHKFGWVRSIVIVAILGCFWILLGMAFYSFTGILFYRKVGF